MWLCGVAAWKSTMLARAAVRCRAPRASIARSLSSFGAPAVTRTAQPAEQPPPESLIFGRTMSDHMFRCDWSSEGGWGEAAIVPHEPIAISPACLGLHLGISCFEGMKAYRDPEGGLRLFRPDRNMARFQNSLARVAAARDRRGYSRTGCPRLLARA